MKAWQRGYELGHLQGLARHWQRAEAERVLGGFSRVNEAWVAERLAAGRLVEDRAVLAGTRRVGVATTWRRLGGEPAAHLPRGSTLIERPIVRTSPEAAAEVLARYHPTALVALLPDVMAEATAELLGLCWVGSKVTAASEVLACWGHPAGRAPSPRQLANLLRLDLDVAPAAEELAAQVAAQELDWVQHYSAYNRRRSWTAVALRGFGGPGYVEKPAEMPKGWKAEHPGWQQQRCADTPLRAQLPAVEPLLAALGTPLVERVRLMALAPSGGELSRHADVTDHDAGLADGQLARVHVPLITRPEVAFTTWGLRTGLPATTHLGKGEAWVLDHSKPHAAVNPSGARRVHLVVDAWVDGPFAHHLDRAAGR